MNKKTNYSPQKAIPSFSALLICLCIMTRDTPRIFSNYANKPYLFPYLLTMVVLALTIMISGLCAGKPRIISLLQSRWARIICCFLLSPLWITLLIESAGDYLFPLLGRLYPSTVMMHLWLGWVVCIGIALLLAQWFLNFESNKGLLIDIAPLSIILGAGILLLIYFVGSNYFSALLIFAVTLSAGNAPSSPYENGESSSAPDKGHRFRNPSLYLGAFFVMGLSYQLLESVSNTSKIHIEPNYIRLAACTFVIALLSTQLYTALRMERAATPNRRLTLGLLAAFILSIPLWAFLASRSHSLPFSFSSELTRGVYTLAALSLEVSSFILLFRTVSYLGGDSFKNLLFGKSAFYFGMALGILIVGYLTARPFFTEGIGLEIAALTGLTCATLLIIISSISGRDRVMRALFGDGKLPHDTQYLEKTPLKMDYIAKEFKLTKQERVVLGYVVRSSTSREIAKELTLSVNTIREYRTNIHRKLEVNSKKKVVELVEAVTDEELNIDTHPSPAASPPC